jgi:cysteine desulfurase
MRRVYLDNNATTPVLPEVIGAMQPYFSEHFGNASSIHQDGQQARAAVERARESVAALLSARSAEIVFTSGGTEGDNTSLFGIVKPGDHIITTAIEHEAVLNSCKRLQQFGCEVTYLSVNGECVVDPDDVRRALRPNTKLISVMMANNETGVLQPLEEIGRIAAEADVYFHTDAVQAAGKVPIDVKAIRCDLLAISGHKFHAPKGVGALYVRKGTLVQPLLYGGKHERSRRAGTEIAREGLTNGAIEKIREMRDRIETAALNIEATGVNGGGAPRVPNTTNLHLDYIEGEAMVIALDLKGIAVSTGAACSSGATEPSHVLMAMGVTHDHARGSMRFSLGKMNTSEDVDYFLSVLPEVLARLRELSPVYAAQKI